MDNNNNRETRISEFENMLTDCFSFKINIKLHFSHNKFDDYVYGIYQADKKFILWKTADVFLGEIATPDFSLPFCSGIWEDLNITISNKNAEVGFINFAKQYETLTGKTTKIIKHV